MSDLSNVRGFSSLRRFIRERPPGERCELCSAELGAGHQHLLEPSTRKLLCACEACAVLFSGQAGTKYRRVPRRIRFLTDFRMSDGQWDALMVPINMAFFFYSSPQQKVVALYPSPAGPTESLLPLDSWQDIVQENPILSGMESDVEALLVSRVDRSHGRSTAEYYLAPIDECFKLVGLIRANWRGLSGGAEVWEEIARFFESLKQRSGGSGAARA
jgi:hypothetical protein